MKTYGFWEAGYFAGIVIIAIVAQAIRRRANKNCKYGFSGLATHGADDGHQAIDVPDGSESQENWLGHGIVLAWVGFAVSLVGKWVMGLLVTGGNGPTTPGPVTAGRREWGGLPWNEVNGGPARLLADEAFGGTVDIEHVTHGPLQCVPYEADQVEQKRIEIQVYSKKNYARTGKGQIKMLCNGDILVEVNFEDGTKLEKQFTRS